MTLRDEADSLAKIRYLRSESLPEYIIKGFFSASLD